MSEGSPSGPGQDPAPRSYTGWAVRGALWTSLARVLKSGLNLVAIAALSRILSAEEFGLAAAALTVATLGAVLTDGTFALTLLQAKEVSREDVGAALALSLGLGLLLAVGVCLTAQPVALAFGFPALPPLLIAVAPVLPLGSTISVGTALLQRGGEFRSQTLVTLIAQTVYLAVALTMAAAGMGVWSLVASQVASSTTQAVVYYRVGIRPHRPRVSREALRSQLRTGGMFTIAKLFKWAAFALDRVVVGRVLGPASLGIYTRCMALLLAVNEVAGAGASRVLLSAFSKIQDDTARMGNAVARALGVVLLVTGVVSCGVVAFADLVVAVLLGDGWSGAVPVMQALFLALPARSAWVVTEAAATSLHRNRENAVRGAMLLVLTVTGATLGASVGLTEAAVGVGIAFWVFYATSLIWVARLLGLPLGPLAGVHAKTLAVLLPIAGAVWLVPAALAGSPAWVVEVARMTVFLALVGALGLLAPASIVGADLAGLRLRVWKKVRR